jgi:hypothetical protein
MMSYKFYRVFICLFLVACQNEPEVVDVNKVLKCFGAKPTTKEQSCNQLNDTEKKALTCFTSKEKSIDKCKGVSQGDMTFTIDREQKPAKQAGTQFKFHLNSPHQSGYKELRHD